MTSVECAPSADTADKPFAPATMPWVAILVMALAAVLYRMVLWKLVRDWWIDPDFSHGFIVPLFSVYLAYRSRHRWAATPKHPSWAGVFVVAGGLALLILGVTGAELFVTRVSGLILLAGIILTFEGWRRLRVLAFPILFLLLAFPIPRIIFNQITFPLQLLASQLAAAVLPLLQVPVFREGNVINLSVMPLQVAEACSGIRSLMSLGTLAIIYGFFLEGSIWKRVVLVLVSVPIAVACNAARVVGTGLCVQYWDPIKALGFFHEFSGWVIFLFSLVILFGVHKALSLIPDSKEPS